MVGRKIKGFFLGVPILSEGSNTEDERLRRDGFGYAFLSLTTFLAKDYTAASLLLSSCLCVTIYVNIFSETSFRFRITSHCISSVVIWVAIWRSDVPRLAPIFAMATLVYYGLMYFTRFDR